MAEIDRLLGEMSSGIKTLGKSVDILRSDYTTFAGRVEDSHTAIHTSISDLNVAVTGIEEGHHERIKSNAAGITLIWRVLLGTGAIGVITTAVIKALSYN